MDTPELTFRCWLCRQPFRSDELLIFVAPLPEELQVPPRDKDDYQCTLGLAYLCHSCTASGLTLTAEDMQAAFGITRKDTTDDCAHTQEPRAAPSAAEPS